MFGQYVEDPTLCDLWSGTPFIMGGRSTASVQINEYGRLRMIVMSTGMGTRYATDDELAQYADSIAAAPNYPADGACGSRTASCSSVSATRARYIINRLSKKLWRAFDKLILSPGVVSRLTAALSDAIIRIDITVPILTPRLHLVGEGTARPGAARTVGTVYR